MGQYTVSFKSAFKFWIHFKDAQTGWFILSVIHLRKKLKLSGPIIKESLWSYLKRLPSECSFVYRPFI